MNRPTETLWQVVFSGARIQTERLIASVQGRLFHLRQDRHQEAPIDRARAGYSGGELAGVLGPHTAGRQATVMGVVVVQALADLAKVVQAGRSVGEANGRLEGW